MSSPIASRCVGTARWPMRLAPTHNPTSGLSDATGQSLPNASRPPASLHALPHPAARGAIGADVAGPLAARLGGVHQSRVRRLERADDAERAEARHVGHVHRLDVLDAMAAPARRRGVGPGGLLEGIEHAAHAAVADGVNHDLVAAGVEHAHDAVELLDRVVRKAGAGGVVVVGREHHGGVRLDHAVNQELRCAHLEAVVALDARADLVEPVGVGVGEAGADRERRIHAQAQSPDARRSS